MTDLDGSSDVFRIADLTGPSAANMNSTPSSSSESVVWPSLATASVLQVHKLANEIRDLRRNGETSPLRAILERHPELATDKSVVIELVNEDLCQRSEAGESLDPNEYCNQFQVFQEEVRQMALAHGFVEEKVPLLDQNRLVSFPETGKEFMEFSLLRELGRGAFACVYLAAEPALGNRLVAVKVSQHGATEADILGRLTHRNIVPIHSVKKDPLTGFIVVCMPYLGSATLCDLLKKIRTPSGVPHCASAILEASQDRIAAEYAESHQRAPDSILRNGTYVDGVLNLGVQLAEALAFIHSLGICHSDLKPSNVLMRPDGRPMLLDFNLSFREQPVDHRLGGTFPYMSPEFLRAMDPNRRGFPAQVDARSDVFSLGVMLCELLTGQHPFGPLEKIDNYEHLRQQLLEEQEKGFRVGWSKNRQVDSRIRRLLDKCLAFRPEERPQTASELARALRRSLSRRQRFQRWAKLNARLLVECCALGVGLTALGTYWVIPKGPYSIRQFNKGMELYRAGKYEEASEYFNRAIHQDARFADAQFALGRTYQRSNQFAPAAEAFLAADKLRPDGRTQACESYCSAKLNYFPKAIAQANAAIDADFATAEVYNNRGYCYLQQKNLDLAQSDLEKAIRLDGSLQAPHFNLAVLELYRAFKNRGDKSTCLHGNQQIQIALKIGPERADLYYTAAILCARVAEKDNAFVDPTLDFLAQSIRLGLRPKQLEEDVVGFKAVANLPRFKQLAASVPSQSDPEPTPRLLDPVLD